MDKKDIRTYEHPDLESYPTPASLKDKHAGQSALIIGTGPSCKQLLDHRDQLRSKFDVIIGLNFSIIDFEQQLDYHLVLENKPTKVEFWMRQNPHRKDLTRILNNKAIRFFPSDLNIIKADRWDFDGKPDIRNYDVEGGSGLFAGYEELFIDGSVIIQAVHLAGIMGCNKIYTIGGDLYFKDKRYYYGDDHSNKYRITHKPMNRLGDKQLALCEVEFRGEKVWSLPVYAKSALCVNKLAKEECEPNGIEVYDFSDGLLTTRPVIVSEFFQEEEKSNEVG